MITAQQSAKVKTAAELMRAMDIIYDNQNAICLGPKERKFLAFAIQALDNAVQSILPSREGPDKEGS